MSTKSGEEQLVEEILRLHQEVQTLQQELKRLKDKHPTQVNKPEAHQFKACPDCGHAFGEPSAVEKHLQEDIIPARVEATQFLHCRYWCGHCQKVYTGPDSKPMAMSGKSTDILRRQPDGRRLIVVDNPWGTEILSA